MVSGLRDVLIDKNSFSENTVNLYLSYQTFFLTQIDMLLMSSNKKGLSKRKAFKNDRYITPMLNLMNTRLVGDDSWTG